MPLLVNGSNVSPSGQVAIRQVSALLPGAVGLACQAPDACSRPRR